MASFQIDKDELSTCPYNPCHKVKKCRLQVHIAKCKDKHEEDEKRICPFNAQHRVSVPDYHHHLQTCPNRSIMDRKLVTTNLEQAKRTIPESQTIVVSGENWEDEILHYPASAYDPKQAARQPIFPDVCGMLPSQKKQLYKSLHSKSRKLPSEPEKENIVETEWTLKQIRQPKKEPEVMKFRPLDTQCSSLGLGRGQPSGNRRIAARFSGPQSEPQPQDDIVAPTCLGRGIGRGFQS